MSRIFVIAGKYWQYKDWLRRNGLNPGQFVYASDANHLRGQRGWQYVYVGAAWENPLYRHFMLNALDMQEITEADVLANKDKPC